MKTLRELLSTLPQTGRVDWVGVRPVRQAPMVESGAIRVGDTVTFVANRE